MEEPRTVVDIIRLAMQEEHFEDSEDAMKGADVFKLLRDAMVNAEKPPPINSEEVRKLTQNLNLLKYHCLAYDGNWDESLRTRASLLEALRTILKAGAVIRQEFLDISNVVDSALAPAGNANLASGIAMMNRLLASAEEVLGSPIGSNSLLAGLQPKPEWELYATEAASLFRDAVDHKNPPNGVSKAAAYRFAASAVSQITGRQVTGQMVEALLKKGRNVNRGRNFFNLSRVKPAKMLPP